MLNAMLKRRYDKFSGQCGDKFGRLTLTGESYIKQAIGHRGRVVEAVCDCGVVKWYWYHLIRSGETQSCGCYKRDVTKKRMTTHNLSDHPLYDVYKKIISRCYDEKDKAYKNYGGRGIEVWLDWKEDFLVFYDWCIENGWQKGLSVERKENGGNYSPQNCKLATTAEQSRNKRNTRNYTAFGETKCLFDWGKDPRCVVTVWALRGRMDKDKWANDFEAALTTTAEDGKRKGYKESKTCKKVIAFGETKSLADWVKDKRCVVAVDRLRDRIAEGWNHLEAITTVHIDRADVNLTAFGETKSVAKWLKDERCVVKVDALRDRYRRGWAHEDCITTPSKTRSKK